MDAHQFLVFIPTALLLAIAPGPDNLGVLALALSSGRRASLGFAIGCAAGCLNHTVLAAIGISALIAASPTAFGLLQWAGAAYLAWIGWKSLRSAWSAGSASASTKTEENHFLPHFKRGLIANSINPKVALFFLAFLPQFVRADGWPAPLQLIVLGSLFGLCALIVFCAIAFGAGAIGGWLNRRKNAYAVLQGMTGVLFIGLALRLAFSRSPA
jgi:threonine/homoserine/homoserine lactone efflux protein